MGGRGTTAWGRAFVVVGCWPMGPFVLLSESVCALCVRGFPSCLGALLD